MLTKAEKDLKEYIREVLNCELPCWGCFYNDPVATDPFYECYHPDKCNSDIEGVCCGYDPVNGWDGMIGMHEIDCRDCKNFNL